MNKLQKLYSENIEFTITTRGWETILWEIGKGEEVFEDGFRDTLDEAIDALWQAAKKHYPDAKCFKEMEGPVLGTQPTPIRRF